jgi:aerotaxis receptor
MWQTLKAGIPWTGAVKNRRYNGDSYWVHANVTPVQRDGRILGYVSVRTEPTRQEINSAQALYANINAGASALGIHRGVVVYKGWLRWLSLARTASLRTRFIGAMLGLLVPTAAAIAVLSLPAGATAILGTALGLGALVAFAIAQNQILSPLHRVSRHAQIAAGGQSQTLPEFHRTDAIGMLLRAINQMSVNQATIISDVKARINGLHQSCREIAQGNMDLSGRTEQQASNLEQTAASMEQMAAAVHAISEASTRANALAANATQAALRGGDVVGQVTAKMDEISSSSHRIADIISVIDGIAFQTNILALNAAVEAARAGEQGRGFAVVASEVRTLAQRSADAAKEIKALIGTSVDSVQAGSSAVRSAGTTMDEIVHHVQQVASLIGEIATSIHEQTAGIGQVNQAVSHTDQVTQQNAALVEQTAAASTSLSQQAEELRAAVSSFEFA